MRSKIFRDCFKCNKVWDNRNQFLSDPEIVISKYQANFVELEAGFFIFKHNCGATLVFPVETFSDLYDGEIFGASLRGSEGCPEYCLNKTNLNVCHQNCECAFVREVLNAIKGYPKEEKNQIDSAL